MSSLRNNHSAKHWAPWLFALLFLFILRVVGQLAVVLGFKGFLPPMEKWQSGVLPYPILLISQFMIIFILAKVCIDFARGEAKISRRQGKMSLDSFIFLL